MAEKLSYRITSCVVVITLALALCGCGDGRPSVPEAKAVSGTVLLDGKPLKDGLIMFSDGGMAALQITDGSFSGKVTPGEKKVQIKAFEGYEAQGDPKSQMPQTKVPKNILPERFSGAASTLKATISPSGELTPNKFEVTSK